MKRTLLSVVVALALVLPTTLTQPKPVSAACVPLWAGVTLSLLTLGVASVLLLPDACDSFGTRAVECDITQVSTDASKDDKGLNHRYDYRFTESCGSVHITGGTHSPPGT